MENQTVVKNRFDEMDLLIGVARAILTKFSIWAFNKIRTPLWSWMKSWRPRKPQHHAVNAGVVSLHFHVPQPSVTVERASNGSDA